MEVLRWTEVPSPYEEGVYELSCDKEGLAGMRVKMESTLKAQMSGFRRWKWALRCQGLQFAWRAEQSWAGFTWGNVEGDMVVRVQGRTRGPACCRVGRKLCLVLGKPQGLFPSNMAALCLRLVRGAATRCLVFTSLTYLWLLISEGRHACPPCQVAPSLLAS